MLHKFSLAWLLLMSAFGLVVAAHADTLAIGSSLPDFAIKNVDGQMLTKETFASKAALVIVFASNHCPFVQAYEGRLAALQKDYVKKDVQILLVNANDAAQQPQDSFAAMQAYARDKKFPFLYACDSEQKLAKALGAERTPEVFVFGKDRKLIYQGRFDDNTEEKNVRTHDVQDALDLLLAGTPEKIEPKITKAFGCTIKWKK